MSFTESEINPSFPTERDATTASVRDNFTIAQREITAINEAISTALTGAPYLSIAGGELTGRLLLPGGAPDHLRAAVTQGWVQSYVSGEAGAGLPEAPTDGATYGRANSLWHPVLPLAGGVLTGALTLAGPPTVDLHAATKAYCDAAGVTSFNTRIGAVMLLSADVTNALTFTPYNATNPAGYQTAAQVTTALANYLPLTGGELSGALTIGGGGVKYNAFDWGEDAIAFGYTIDRLRLAVDGAFIGNVALESDVLSIYGGTLMGGLSMGSAIVASPTDLSRHFALYGDTYGINLTSGRINYVLPPGATHVFIAGGGDRMSIGTAGVTMLETANLTLAFDPTLPLHAATKAYVDAALAVVAERVTALEARR